MKVDELILNTTKPVDLPGPHQVLCFVEATSLCFSDLKLLKQFSSHVRKSSIVSGIDPAVLEEIPSYVPDEEPTVLGHETVVRVSAVGDKVEGCKPGERYLLQTDYRWLLTENSNAAFGYNFEGGLQEYVLMDERVITSPEGDSMLIPVPDELSASAIALVEPWACVENSYASSERRGIKENGRMAVVAEKEVPAGAIADLLNRFGRPSVIDWVSQGSLPEGLDVRVRASVSGLENGSCDDIVYFGSRRETAEDLFVKLGVKGLFNIVLCDEHFEKDVIVPVGRMHYGGIRITGTTGWDPCESMKHIPASGEIREGDRINVVGAGGPMGMMHVVRNICQGVNGVSVFAGDLSVERLDAMTNAVGPIAKANGVSFRTYNPAEDDAGGEFSYVAIMVPSAALVAGSIADICNGAIINIFAGIPIGITHEIDLNTYIEKRAYFIGTSGSTLSDMYTVLEKVKEGRLDTNISVAAVCGLKGAIEGIRAVENRLVSGKIVVYPSCGDMDLTTLENLDKDAPHVAARLDGGLWNLEAEKALLEHGA